MAGIDRISKFSNLIRPLEDCGARVSIYEEDELIDETFFKNRMKMLREIEQEVNEDMNREAELEKRVREHAAIGLLGIRYSDETKDIDDEIRLYQKRLREMYNSDAFQKHSSYSSTNAVHVYAVIAMCLGLKHFDLSDS